MINNTFMPYLLIAFCIYFLVGFILVLTERFVTIGTVMLVTVLLGIEMGLIITAGIGGVA